MYGYIYLVKEITGQRLWITEPPQIEAIMWTLMTHTDWDTIELAAGVVLTIMIELHFLQKYKKSGG